MYIALQQFILDCSAGDLEKVRTALESNNSINVNGKDEQGTPALNYAVMLGHVDIVSLLLSVGADPSIKDAKGRDALRWASRSANQELKNLILHNATPTTSPRSSMIDISLKKRSLIVESKSELSTSGDSNNSQNQSSELEGFDWSQGKPCDMIPFDPDDTSHILNVAIRTIVPSKKSRFLPLGANALFLCAR